MAPQHLYWYRPSLSLSLSLSLILSLSLTLSLRHDGDTCAENNLVDESSIFFFAEDTRVSRVHEIIFSPSRKKNPFFFKTTPSAAEEISSYFGLRPIYVNMQRTANAVASCLQFSDVKRFPEIHVERGGGRRRRRATTTRFREKKQRLNRDLEISSCPSCSSRCLYLFFSFYFYSYFTFFSPSIHGVNIRVFVVSM